MKFITEEPVAREYDRPRSHVTRTRTEFLWLPKTSITHYCKYGGVERRPPPIERRETHWLVFATWNERVSSAEFIRNVRSDGTTPPKLPETNAALGTVYAVRWEITEFESTYSILEAIKRRLNLFLGRNDKAFQ